MSIPIKKLYCRHCKKWVEKGVKNYYYPTANKIDYSRDVCGGGCNTDWNKLIKWSEEPKGQKTTLSQAL